MSYQNITIVGRVGRNAELKYLKNGVALCEFRAANLRVAIQPFNTTNQSKADAVEALALEMEKGRVTLLDDPTQKAELKAFTSERTPNGATRLAAAQGISVSQALAALAEVAAQSQGFTGAVMLPRGKYQRKQST